MDLFATFDSLCSSSVNDIHLQSWATMQEDREMSIDYVINEWNPFEKLLLFAFFKIPKKENQMQ